MTTKRNIERRLEELEGDDGDDGVKRISVNHVLVGLAENADPDHYTLEKMNELDFTVEL